MDFLGVFSKNILQYYNYIFYIELYIDVSINKKNWQDATFLDIINSKREQNYNREYHKIHRNE